MYCFQPRRQWLISARNPVRGAYTVKCSGAELSAASSPSLARSQRNQRPTWPGCSASQAQVPSGAWARVGPGSRWTRVLQAAPQLRARTPMPTRTSHGAHAVLSGRKPSLPSTGRTVTCGFWPLPTLAWKPGGLAPHHFQPQFPLQRYGHWNRPQRAQVASSSRATQPSTEACLALLSGSLPVTPTTVPPADWSLLHLFSENDPVPDDLAAHVCSMSSPKGLAAGTFLFTRSLLWAPGRKVKSPVLEPHCCVCVILGQLIYLSVPVSPCICGGIAAGSGGCCERQ